MIDGLGFVRLEVGDLGRSLSFYRGGLRFELVDPEAPVNGRATLRAGALLVELVERAPTAPSGGEDAGGAAAQRILLAVAVDGVDAYHDALVARGVAPSPPRDEDGRRGFSVADPDGVRWRFVEGLR